MQTIEVFRQASEQYQKLEQQQKRQLNRISQLRLSVFLVAAVIGILSTINEYIVWGIAVSAILFVLFVGFVIYHHKIKRKWQTTGCYITIYQQYIDRITGSWGSFKDSGRDFINSKHPYMNDLDLFGNNSLFQWINLANTHDGRVALHDLLVTPDKDPDAIRVRQKAIAELAQKHDFCNELQAAGMLAEDISDSPERLLSYIEKSETIIGGGKLKFAFYLLPICTVLSIPLSLFGFVAPMLPIILIAIHVAITAVGYGKNATTLNVVYKYKSDIEAYRSVIAVIERESFNDEHLVQLKEQFQNNGRSVSEQLKSLERLAGAIDMRHSALLYFILNGLLLWDYHCMFALEKWKDGHGKSVRRWIGAVGDFEALSSLAVIARINPDWSFPEIIDQQQTVNLQIEAEQMGHPLIQADKRVSNDFAIQNSLGVVTGSNMSGKTTLLRTIGINLVLAYAGAPVCAKKMQCSILEIFTSMRITDDLNSGISSFYAELLRIKMIIDFAQEKKPMIFLIDEIFRGTNSLDRITGARTVLKNLSKEWIIGLISTHDFELCDLENDGRYKIQNYYFTEHYIDDQLKFDYVLRSGRCKTANARYLMKMVGIRFDEDADQQ